ncbi:Uncharacterised protein [Aedoeadaptatus ivorii]|uniref:Antitoxin n=1 Tax=Aedoeadaptatus ivorii TaxID=54006 RepID=A0A3S4YKL0_9FIRM|nr:DUF6290 family protein [Peptoniphilus ivorii]VEJ35322.1 Uncharacterised protein [Peptoniphilus ivorii]
METITIRVKSRDKALFKRVSKEKNKSISNWARETLLSSIEDEYDVGIVEEYLKNEDSMKFYTADEVDKELER